MKVIDNFFLVEEATVATVGFFDGVHCGHQYLIDCLKEEAWKSNLKSAVITFPVHPCKILYKDYQPFLLTTFEEKIYRLSLTGLDYCYIIPFTLEFSSVSAKDFMQKILAQQLQVKKLLVGYDHQFGQGRNTTYTQYAEYGKTCGISVLSIGKFPEKDYPNSSTSIRRLLLEGKPEKASAILTYDFFLEGTVIHGNHLGRTFGFPTANIYYSHTEKIIPREGVYAAYVWVRGEKYIGMAYVGKRPTVTAKEEKRVEVNLFNFDQDIYGEIIRIAFRSFIRQDIRFRDLTELKNQLEKDKHTIQKSTIFAC